MRFKGRVFAWGALVQRARIFEVISVILTRESTDRFLAAWLSERVGAEFSGKINGVTKSGLFVCLDENGADGFIPARTIGNEYFIFDEGARALIGERSKLGYRIGQKVDVRLREVTPLQGGLLFEMLSEPEKGIQRSASSAKSRSPAGRSRQNKNKNNKSKAAKHRRKRKQSR